MDKQTLNDKLKQLAAAPSCCPELKAAIQAYFDAAGTPDEKSATENLLAEIEDDIQTVDGLVAFAHSQRAVDIFGVEGQKKFRRTCRRTQSFGREILRLSRLQTCT